MYYDEHPSVMKDIGDQDSEMWKFYCADQKRVVCLELFVFKSYTFQIDVLQMKMVYCVFRDCGSTIVVCVKN